MAKLRDLAKSLGLSVTTVSRALGGYPEVSEVTRAQVREAAERMGYHPNPIAQKLATGRSGMVGLITLRPVRAATDPSLMEVLFGLSSALAEHDIDLILRVGIEQDVVEPYRRLVAKKMVDAFIVNAPSENDLRVCYLQKHSIPFVMHGRDKERPDYPFYDMNNFQAGVDSARYLVELGHRRIAFLNGPENLSFARDRLRGLRQVLQGAGISLPAGFVQHGVMDDSYGYIAAMALLSGLHGPVPTAILCASTLIADGVLRALEERGLTAPGDVSIMAHDDDLPDAKPHPLRASLTVTRLPMTAACKPLVTMVLGAIEGDPLEKLQTIAIAELIVKQTTGPAREA
ncbi:MAG: substrate-binding domain-containing protein [Deltaproteobacteria bacterium]